ncbi:MAG: 50S ribosomal protein L13 [Candidatus Binatia bacterium]|nr:50S ribosomal protein L13 [Candidatus Binatia bacterium]
MKTTTVPVSAPQWFIIDAEGQSLGRLATKAAHLLRGKHKPSFAPHQICGDQVVVVNAGKLNFGWRRLQQKEYIKHSGYLGHQKAISIKDLLATHPERVVELAVKGMLPKNRLRNELLKRLHVFPGVDHTHTAQQPQPFPLA